MLVYDYVEVKAEFLNRINTSSEVMQSKLSKRIYKLTEWIEEGIRKRKEGLI